MRILRAGASVRDTDDEWSSLDAQSRPSYWYEKAQNLPLHFAARQHYIRLLTQKAEFAEFMAAEKMLIEKAEAERNRKQEEEQYVAALQLLTWTVACCSVQRIMAPRWAAFERQVQAMQQRQRAIAAANAKEQARCASQPCDPPTR